MTTLQEYLNQKYPTQSEKEQIKEINNEKINQELEEAGENNLLEGGSLDLTGFKNLEKIKIDPQFSKTALDRLYVKDLVNLEEIFWLNAKEDGEENKKLWAELEIENNFYKKRTVREIQKLVESFSQNYGKKINVKFAVKKALPEELKSKNSSVEKKDDKFLIHLQLEREDKLKKFSPKLVLWSMIWELTFLNSSNYTEDPLFWNNLKKELKWTEKKLTHSCKSWIIPLNPSDFPSELLEMKEFLTIYFPNNEEIVDNQFVQTTVNLKIVDNAWKNIVEKIPGLIEQELAKNPSEEKKKELAIKATIEKSDERHYVIKIQYHSKNPLQEKMKELVNTVPLKLELEKEQEEKKQLPTPKDYEIMIKKVNLLEKTLQNHLDNASYKKIKEEINNIQL